MVSAYLNHRLHARKRHGVHSPFVYELGEKVIYASGTRKVREIESLRRELIREKERIELTDYGAGSRRSNSSKRSISQIARYSSSPAKVSRLLQRLVAHFDFKNVIEIGGNLGLTTAYLAAAENAPKVISLEGDPGLARKAVKNLEKLEIRAEIIEGRFEETLALTLKQMEPIDFAYIDGNHREKPTLQYFEMISEKMRPNSVVAIGDIYWSKEMESAWESIKNHPLVTLTIDLFDLGLVFFRRDRVAKEHFRLRI